MDVMEIRQDPITGLYVAISEGRSKRPNAEFLPATPLARSDWDTDCFFCPGNENKTPPEIWAYRMGDFWWIRGVPNKFPIFPNENDQGLEKILGEDPDRRFYNSRPINGRHDVIIDTPRHNEELHDRSEGQIREMLWFYKELLGRERRDGKVKYVLVYKNRGKIAGASIEHPHTQFIVSPVPLLKVTSEIEGARRYFAGDNRLGIKERCGYCAVSSHELEMKGKYGLDPDRHRIVDENLFFVAFTPYASRMPFEILIMPRIHQADYEMMEDAEATHLARIVQTVFRKLETAFPGVSYNMGLHTLPLNTNLKSPYHWHIEVVPILKRDAGLEKFGGLPVNPVSPERAAYILNQNP